MIALAFVAGLVIGAIGATIIMAALSIGADSDRRGQ